MDCNENVIEWITGAHTITCTFTQRKFISKVHKLKEKFPDKVHILAENTDGSIVVRLPIKALKLSIIERDLSDEQREEMSRRFKERIIKED